MSTNVRKRSEKRTASSDAAIMERLVQLEHKVDALCRYLLPCTGRYAYALPDVRPVWLVKPPE